MKLAVVLFNLGGPKNIDGVEPFLRNLFSDPAIISLPAPFRFWLARFIAKRRAPTAAAIYQAIGGGSPILRETETQAKALQQALGDETRVFIAMRYTPPFAADTVRALQQYQPDHIILLPLYPQYSKTTSGSSIRQWYELADAAGLRVPTEAVCCYPTQPGFIAALHDLTNIAAQKCRAGLSYRLLLSAHGLPQQVINGGDPYAEHIEATAKALAASLKLTEYQVCYQSKVGPLKWIGPATLDEIKRAGSDGKAVLLVPIAFVSEHSETLYELDIDYAEQARHLGVPDYIRVPAVGCHPSFIDGLAELVRSALQGKDHRAEAGCCSAGRQCGYQH